MNKQQILIVFFFVFLILYMTNFINAEMFNNSVGVSYDSNILEQFKNNTKVNIFFRLNNFSEASSILSNFSEDEIKNVIERNISNLIGLEITEKGFNKLINDKRVKAVYFNDLVFGVSCGNKICDNLEDCTSCSVDCGKCKEVSSLVNSPWFWVILFIVILLMVLVIYLIKRRK